MKEIGNINSFDEDLILVSGDEISDALSNINSCSDAITCEKIEKILNRDNLPDYGFFTDRELDDDNDILRINIDLSGMNWRTKNKFIKRLNYFIVQEMKIIKDGY